MLSLEVNGTGDETVVSIHAAAASGLKALYCMLRYDGRRLHAAAAQPAPPFGPPDGVLSMMVERAPGVLDYGQVLIRPQAQAGFSGDGVIAALHFAAGPAPQRAASAVPPQNEPLTVEDWNYQEIRWYYDNWGDYDQNGEVNIADLGPLASHFGETPLSGQHFYQADVQSLIDGDRNGEINIGDLAAIGLHFGHSALGGYDVFKSESGEDYPADASSPNGPGAQLEQHVAFADAVLIWPRQTRLEFRSHISDENDEDVFWVRDAGETAGGSRLSNKAGNVVYKPAKHGRFYSDWDFYLEYWPEGSGVMCWFTVDFGDCNQDSATAIGDIDEIALHFTQMVDYDDTYSALSVVDTDHNSEVNIADLNAIGYHLDEQISGYSIYASNNETDYSQDAPSIIEPLGSVAYSQALGDPAVDRLRFQYTLGSPPPARYVWVRPYCRTGEEGWASDLLDTQPQQ